MAAISRELVELHRMFSDFLEGRTRWTIDDWHAFRRRLSFAACRASMEELGVDTTVIDVAHHLQDPNSNVLPFPGREERHIRANGGAA